MIFLPELPEVETVRKGLEQLIQGKEIQSVDVFWNRIIDYPDVTVFKSSLIGQTILEIKRRGKYLIFKLSDADLISHLRMEGKYEYQLTSPEKKSKHTHVVFHFTDGSQLSYHDVRKFGRMALVPKDTAISYKAVALLGPEPTDSTFLLEDFENKLARSSRAIKTQLLDQTMVAGLGNIYANEVLWEAKIHPEQPANTLTKKEIIRLRKTIIAVLDRAVKAGGTTIRSYVNALGEAGHFQVSLNAYGKTNQPCPRCLTPIVKIKVGQRGTHFCPNCQKLRRRKIK